MSTRAAGLLGFGLRLDMANTPAVRTAHESAASLRPANRQVSTDQSGTVSHDLQTHPLRIDGRLDADAVVLHPQRDRLIIALEAHPDVPGLACLRALVTASRAME